MNEYVPTEILPWSHKEYVARKDWPCFICGGVIPMGTPYLCRIVRGSTTIYKGGIGSRRQHLNCEMPWHFPDVDVDRAKNWGNLPGRTAPRDEEGPGRISMPHVVSLEHADLGTLLWKLPKKLQDQINFMPKSEKGMAALAEASNIFGVIIDALLASAGNKRRSRELSIALNVLSKLGMMQYDLPKPKKKRIRKKKEVQVVTEPPIE